MQQLQSCTYLSGQNGVLLSRIESLQIKQTGAAERGHASLTFGTTLCSYCLPGLKGRR